MDSDKEQIDAAWRVYSSTKIPLPGDSHRDAFYAGAMATLSAVIARLPSRPAPTTTLDYLKFLESIQSEIQDYCSVNRT